MTYNDWLESKTDNLIWGLKNYQGDISESLKELMEACVTRLRYYQLRIQELEKDVANEKKARKTLEDMIQEHLDRTDRLSPQELTEENQKFRHEL